MFPDSSKGEGFEASTSAAGLSQRCCQFEFHEILLATDNFNESLVVGKGGFGKVYKGNISIGTTHVDVAIKRMDLMSNQGATEFWAEVEMLSKLRHAHLVSLIGYCNFEKEMILVYEYMPHGTLEDHLHKLHTPISWLERLKICIGAARGLDYLHTGTSIEVCVIHRDVKSSNILLHESWEAKISDFGLAKTGPTNQPSTYVNTLIKGTFGYIDPNYFATGKLTRKSDVYAFGVVLFEVLCQKRPLDQSFECGLATWIQDSIKEGNLKKIVYSGIQSEISPKCLKGFARIAERCLSNHPNHRPTMTEVVFSLQSLLAQSVLSSHHKTNNWLQTPDKKIFRRIFNVFPFSSPGKNLGILISPDENSSTPISRGENSGLRVHDARPMEEIQIASQVQNSNGVLVKKLSHLISVGNRGHLEEFSIQRIIDATDNFSEEHLIGAGSFGSVYHGSLTNGRKVAIKRAELTSSSSYTKKHQEDTNNAFVNDLEFLSCVNHKNLVQLLGFCEENNELVLVYKFMENGSLHDHLHNSFGSHIMSWPVRIKVALDTARGIEYLHVYAQPPIIHRDIKSSNILLDDEWTGKVSDFGLSLMGLPNNVSHLSVRAMGTIGYIDPEYYSFEKLTTKSDVYSFGVVLLELLSGHRVIHKNEAGEISHVVDSVVPYIVRDEIHRILDHKVPPPTPFEIEAVKYVGYLAVDCVTLEGRDRPTMSELVTCLERALSACLTIPS